MFYVIRKEFGMNRGLSHRGGDLPATYSDNERDKWSKFGDEEEAAMACNIANKKRSKRQFKVVDADDL